MASGNTKKFFQNTTVNFAGAMLGNFLAFILNLILVKIMTVADYGEYTSAVAYIAIFSTPLSILTLILTKKISHQPQPERPAAAKKLLRQLRKLARANWWLIFLIPIVWILLARLSNFSSPLSAPTIILVVLTGLIVAIYSAILTGFQFFTIVSLISVAAGVIKLVSGWGLITLFNVWWMIYLTLIITNLFSLVVYYRQVKKQTRTVKTAIVTGPSFALSHVWHQETIILPLVGLLTMTALLNLDLIIVKKVLGGDIAGEYGLFSLFGKILLYASTPLINVAFTYFSSPDANKNRRQIVKIAAGLIIILMLGATTLYYLWPTLLISIMGQAAYLELAPILFLASIFGGVYSLAMLATQYLLARGKRLIYFGLLFPMIQAILIFNFHHHLAQIMLINIGVASSLLIFYCLGIKIASKRNK